VELTIRLLFLSRPLFMMNRALLEDIQWLSSYCRKTSIGL